MSRSIKDSLALNTPVVPMVTASMEKFSAVLDTQKPQVLEDINDAIAVATTDLGLLPGIAFQVRYYTLTLSRHIGIQNMYTRFYLLRFASCLLKL